jgi:hypothetical protein
VHKEALAEDHPSRLASQHALAGAYRADGQAKGAVKLLQYVVSIKQRKLHEAHPSRQVSEQMLAEWYEEDGLLDEAAHLDIGI